MTRPRWRFLAVGLLLGIWLGAAAVSAFESGVPWRAYIDQRIYDYDQRMQDRFEAQQEAIRVLARAADLDNLAGRVLDLEKSKAAITGGTEKGEEVKASTLFWFALLTGALQLFIGVVSFLLARKVALKGA